MSGDKPAGVQQQLGVTLNLDLDPWTDLQGPPRKRMPHNRGGLSAGVLRVGVMPNGTEQGRATVMLDVRLPNGDVVIAETTLRIFLAAASAIAACPVAQLEDL